MTETSIQQVPGAPFAVSTGFSVASYGVYVLQTNPSVGAFWTFYPSAITPTTNVAPSLLAELSSNGIGYAFNPNVTSGSTTVYAGPGTNQFNSGLAVQDFANQANLEGLNPRQQVPYLNGTEVPTTTPYAPGTRVVDVQTTEPGLFGGTQTINEIKGGSQVLTDFTQTQISGDVAIMDAAASVAGFGTAMI